MAQSKNDTIKIVFVVIALAIAGGLLAFNFGVFSSGPSGSELTQEQQENAEEMIKKDQELAELLGDGEPPRGS